MMGQKICFYEEIWIIIPKLSMLSLLILSTVYVPVLLTADSDVVTGPYTVGTGGSCHPSQTGLFLDVRQTENR